LDLYNSKILSEQTEKLLYELYDSINLLILNGLEPVRDSNILFENVEFKGIPIKIIRNISNEKKIFIFKNYIDRLINILSEEIKSSERAYSFDNDLNEEEFKKFLNKRMDESKNEKKELIKLFSGKTTESKININKYNINIPNNNNDSRLNSWEKQNLINEDENEKIYNEISKIIDLKNEIENKIKNLKNKNIKGILITKKIINNSHLHDKFIIEVIN